MYIWRGGILMKLNLSYIAGFFEGEGNAGFYSNGNGSKTRFTIELHQKNPDILYKIRDYFNCGVVYKLPKRSYYRWRVTHSKGMDILKQIYPHLQCRKKEFYKIVKYGRE